jgi:DNA polymerase III epsilon subunit-like protein
MVKIIVFDTETTGFMPSTKPFLASHNCSLNHDAFVCNNSIWNAEEYIESCPYLLQLSYIVYDMELTRVTKIFNKYCGSIDSTIFISEFASNVHHITHAFLDNEVPESKMNIQDMLEECVADMRECDIAVGHNVLFDRNILVAELVRNRMHYLLPHLMVSYDACTFACTMGLTKDVVAARNKKGGRKMPSLLESFVFFYPMEINEECLHNALYDTVLCLLVYLKVCGYSEPVAVKEEEKDIHDEFILYMQRLKKEKEEEEKEKEIV